MSVQLLNPGPEPLSDVILRLPLPVSNDYQRVFGVDFAPPPVQVLDIPEGGKIGLFRLQRIDAGDSAWVYCLIDCRLRAFSPRQIAITTPLPRRIREDCLGPGYKVDPDAEQVSKAAAQIGSGQNDDMETAERINNWMVGRYTYELDDKQLAATEILDAQTGSCSELARAFVALARHNGIPARFVTGSRLRVDAPGYVDMIHHRWLELHVDGYDWFPVDISRNVAKDDSNLRFGAIPARYLALMRTPGLAEDPFLSTDLTMLNQQAFDVLKRRVRLVWYDSRVRDLRSLVRLIKNATPSESRRAHLREDILETDSSAAAPFLAMLLYPPFSRNGAKDAVAALVKIGLPHAAPPLVDAAEYAPPATARAAKDALAELTGESHATADEWRLWLRGTINDLFRKSDRD
jgi:hypothetical protein